MTKKKPQELIYDATSMKLVVVVARVPGCEILSGLKNKPLSERKMNRVVRGIVAVCKKRGVDRVRLGREFIRLGEKIRGKDRG
jgi:hypothetical protein